MKKKTRSACASVSLQIEVIMVASSSSSSVMAEGASWYCGLLLGMLLLLSCCDAGERQRAVWKPPKLRDSPCEEIYVVTEGETLQTIAEKCGDPFILEENPHIHDPDDVFPGLIIKITPFRER